MVSIIYLWATPNQYQASAQIKMAQYNSESTVFTPSAKNIVDPIYVVQKFKLPSAFLPQDIKACGVEASSFPFETLAAAVKFSTVKGADSIIDLKINIDNKEIAITCIKSIVENIKAQQIQVMKPFIDDAHIELNKLQDRLNALQKAFSVKDEIRSDTLAVYLNNRDQIKDTTDMINRLNAFIKYSVLTPVELVSPIYISDAPVYPKKRISLTIGLLAGLFLGLLLVLLKNFLLGFKNHKTLKKY